MNETEHDKFDDELMARARQLATDIQPDRDLWPGVAHAIASPAASPWNRYFAQAAAVLLLIGGSSGLTYLAMSGDGRTPTAEVPAAELRFEPVSGSFGSRYTLGPGFKDARSDLEARLEQELDRLSPETRADVEKNMNTIRAAIAEINVALDNDPDNALLQKLLLSSYEEELSLMKRINGLTDSAMYREDI
jgi:hypothetical protein